jgi:uncharacterized membrane protein YhaH (DUF805 family)
MRESIYWFMAAVKKYFDFKSRARRKEYWYFILVCSLTVISLSIIDSISNTMEVEVGMGIHIGLFTGIYLLLMLCPTLAVTTRRLHDTNRSGWWQLINLIPVVGFFVIFICTLEDSQPGDNQYGKNPRGRCVLIHY